LYRAKDKWRLIRSETLQKLNPSPDALMIALAGLVDDSMLEQIAVADYGTGAEEAILLRRVRDDHEVIAPMPFVLREVLNLTRWSEPERDHPDSEDQQRRGHIIRAFACAVLLRFNVEPSNQGHDDGENQTLAQLLASLVTFGILYQVAALRFVAWRVQAINVIYEDDPFFILALLVLALRTYTDFTADELHEIVDCLYAFEGQVRQSQFVTADNPEPWLLGLTNFDQRHDVWRQIGKEIATLAVNHNDSSIGTLILDIAKRIAGDSTL
jgi:hypothetical protein